MFTSVNIPRDTAWFVARGKRRDDALRFYLQSRVRDAVPAIFKTDRALAAAAELTPAAIAGVKNHATGVGLATVAGLAKAFRTTTAKLNEEAEAWWKVHAAEIDPKRVVVLEHPLLERAAAELSEVGELGDVPAIMAEARAMASALTSELEYATWVIVLRDLQRQHLRRAVVRQEAPTGATLATKKGIATLSRLQEEQAATQRPKRKISGR